MCSVGVYLPGVLALQGCCGEAVGQGGGYRDDGVGACGDGVYDWCYGVEVGDYVEECRASGKISKSPRWYGWISVV